MMNFPEAFEDEIRRRFAGEADDFLRALTAEPPVSVRLNDKVDFAGWTDAVPWCAAGRYLPQRPLFTADPLFHSGAYYVQEASSMFLECVVNQFITSPVRMLDLCAAPGGKSTLLSSALPAGSLLVSNEFVRQRANILAENVTKWGNANVLVANNRPSDFAQFGSFFDAMLVDAPCSGEGMFRKDAVAVSEWSPQNVAMCVSRQREILADSWDALREGGLLIYSTCTFNERENEENVRWISSTLGAEILRIDVNPQWQISQTDEGCHFFPHKTRGEGLFVSALRKTSSAPSFRQKPVKNQKLTREQQSLSAWLENPDDFRLAAFGANVKALPARHFEAMETLASGLRTLTSGILLAEQKGRDFVPDIALALSKNVRRAAFPACEVDLPTALQFLRKEAVSVPDAPKGFVLLTYKENPVGWVKNLGTRANNLYPPEWRIRMREI